MLNLVCHNIIFYYYFTISSYFFFYFVKYSSTDQSFCQNYHCCFQIFLNVYDVYYTNAFLHQNYQNQSLFPRCFDPFSFLPPCSFFMTLNQTSSSSSLPLTYHFFFFFFLTNQRNHSNDPLSFTTLIPFYIYFAIKKFQYFSLYLIN